MLGRLHRDSITEDLHLCHVQMLPSLQLHSHLLPYSPTTLKTKPGLVLVCYRYHPNQMPVNHDLSFVNTLLTRISTVVDIYPMDTEVAAQINTPPVWQCLLRIRMRAGFGVIVAIAVSIDCSLRVPSPACTTLFSRATLSYINQVNKQWYRSCNWTCKGWWASRIVLM